MNNRISYLKKLIKEGQNKSKASRKKEIIQIRAEIKETENRKTVEQNQ